MPRSSGLTSSGVKVNGKFDSRNFSSPFWSYKTIRTRSRTSKPSLGTHSAILVAAPCVSRPPFGSSTTREYPGFLAGSMVLMVR